MRSVPAPFIAFLQELDSLLDGPTELHCLGGFVVSVLYGLKRPTADIDILTALPANRQLLELAGKGSDLQRRHGVYIDMVTVMTPPFKYETRLVDMFPKDFARLRLRALDPYDLALSKLERNVARDREDVMHLARTVPLDTDTLTDRYRSELRYLLGDVDRHDATIKLWVEMIAEARAESDRRATLKER